MCIEENRKMPIFIKFMNFSGKKSTLLNNKQQNIQQTSVEYKDISESLNLRQPTLDDDIKTRGKEYQRNTWSVLIQT